MRKAVFFNPAAPLFSKKRRTCRKKNVFRLAFPTGRCMVLFRLQTRRERNHVCRTTDASDTFIGAAMSCCRRDALFRPAPESCPDDVCTTAGIIRICRFQSVCAAEPPDCRGTFGQPRRHARWRWKRRSGSNAWRPHVPDVRPTASDRGGALQSGSCQRIRPEPAGSHWNARSDVPLPAFPTLFPPCESGADSGLIPPGPGPLPAASFPLRSSSFPAWKPSCVSLRQMKTAHCPHVPPITEGDLCHETLSRGTLGRHSLHRFEHPARCWRRSRLFLDVPVRISPINLSNDRRRCP